MEDGRYQEDRRTLANATNPSELVLTFRRRIGAAVSTGDWRLVQGETLASPGASVGFALAPSNTDCRSSCWEMIILLL